MGKIYFLFGIHNHQPVGNDPYVFRQAFDLCYKPFLDVLKEFPKIKCNIHISGPLFDWIMENEKGYIGILKKMVEEKQIEMISGGYYEPILQTIPDRDKLAQMHLMNEFIKREFSFEPKGMWLTERIWEPYLAKHINEAGLQYTFLDDTHFRKAGIDGKELFGYHVTEESSKPIAVFPISKTLRYKIPFSNAKEVIAVLKSFRKSHDVLITLFDDGEKFGMWPTTHDWVYKKGWLKKFFTLLVKNEKHIETILAQDAINKFPSNGLIYIPNSSYIEMDEWAMEPKDFNRYKIVRDCLKKNGDFFENKKFVNAGFFRNFFSKYPRINYMHKKMLRLSEKMHNAGIDNAEALTDLWKSQCNCGYWHGVFGGYYFGHIRNAIYENLIKAESKLDEKFLSKIPSVEKVDVDLDGMSETMIKNKKSIFSFSDKGAAMVEMSLKEKNFNLLNNVTRRPESYHLNLNGKVKKEIIYDKYERLSFIDHFVGKKISINDFNRGKGVKTLSEKMYKLETDEEENYVNLNYSLKNEEIDFEKRIRLGVGSEVLAEYEFKNIGFSKKFDFAVECNFFLQSPKDAKIILENEEFDVEEKKVVKNVKNLAIRDNFKKIKIALEFDDSDIFILPVYSMTNSIGGESQGVEKMFQEVSILAIKRSKGSKFSIKLSVNGA